jgi:hypothetical protein
MIEGPAGPAPKRPSRPAPLAGLVETLRGAWDRLRSGPRAPRDRADKFLWQLQLAGRIAWVILGGLGLYLVIDLWMLQPEPPRMATPLNGPAGPASGAAQPETLEQQRQRAQEYRSTLASRNPFRLSTERIGDGGGGQSVKSRLLELTAALTVVGINRGGVPEALIEDTEAKRTYFVKVGDEINGLTVSGIDANGVTVSYEGETTVLQ